MLRLILLVTVVITSAASVAGAQQPLHIKPEPLDLMMVGVCSFDVHYSEVRVHGNDLVFFDPQGDLTKEIVAGNFVTTVTNVETGASLTLNISGQFFITPNSDGSLANDAHGRNLFFTTAPEPFLLFHRGHTDLTLTFTEESFELVIHELRGQGVDLCAALAGPA